MKNLLLRRFLAFGLAALPMVSMHADHHDEEAQSDLTIFVDPTIGTGGHGHVFLGANVPFGFVQLGPTEPNRGWDWCSGYHASDSILLGFAHTHLSGTGCGDLGDIRFLPVTSRDRRQYTFAHDDEECRPGYYSLLLRAGGYDTVRAELTATLRTGFHRYTFTPSDSAFVLIDMEWGTGWDRVTDCHLEQESPRRIAGWRHSSGWADRQKLFFVAEFSKDVSLEKLRHDSLALVGFGNADASPLLVKVGLSAVSIQNASDNLASENASWDFERVVREARTAWNRQLGKIRIATPDEHLKRIFYTSLYHTMVAPSVFCDVNGEYRGSDGLVHKASFTNLTTFSLWDTYRAWHPLSTLIHPELQDDIASTMLTIYDEQKTLPVWHLMGCETNCMVGCPAIPVLADQMLKGFKVDAEKAVSAMRTSTGSHRRAHDLLWKHGYIPYDLDPANESIGKGMEYAIAYGCAAKVCPDDDFKRLAKSYSQYFDPRSGFMRAKSSKGEFRKEFDPFAAELNKIKDYTEGNAWQYVWLVPHDVRGLIALFGSEKAFESKLDSLFIVEGDLGKDAPPDITGLIGQYAHGNEPSHHVAYLYNYIGQPWKTARRVRQIMLTQYQDTPDGLCGNEDVGQMSAWYVLSAMGIYQVDPAGGRFVLGSPLFDEVTMQVGPDRFFTIKASGNSPEAIYIQSATLNGKKYTKSYVDFSDIAKGGMLEIRMGSKPSKYGTQKNDRP